MYEILGKRIFDILFGTILIIFFLIPFLVIVVILFLKYGTSGVFFFQERAGLNGLPFKLIKFKTIEPTEVNFKAEIVKNTIVSSRFRIFLRKFSLDEIPQFYNVIKGNMSIIGPRPLYLKYNSQYSERQKLRLSVKPGLSGWAQVNGRNEISWEKKFELDVFYVENLSFKFDLKIIYLTVITVLNRKHVLPFFSNEFSSQST